MKDLYNYNKNITVTTTPSGDKVIVMNDAIYTKLCCDIFDGYMHQKDEKLDATAKDTIALWRAIAGDGEND